MLRYPTAGEPHGQALIAMAEDVPVYIRVGEPEISAVLARGCLGAGRGARMKSEEDLVTLLGGFRYGETLDSPIAIMIGNAKWSKWETVMTPGEVDAGRLAAQTRNTPLTRPRPGHADLAGMQKYAFSEARPILERASAWKTAAWVALSVVAAAFLDQTLGVNIVSHVVELGGVHARHTGLPVAVDLAAIDAGPTRYFDATVTTAMVAQVEECRKVGDTLDGVVKVVVWGLLPGLGFHIQRDRRFDLRFTGALMGIQAIKGVEFDDGFELAGRRGLAAHDEILPSDKDIICATRNAGGVEGGMSTGEVLRVYVAMKPIATVPRALRTVDVPTGKLAVVHHQRSNVCTVSVAGVVAEAVTALVLTEFALKESGGDSVAETHRNWDAYLVDVAARGLGVWW